MNRVNAFATSLLIFLLSGLFQVCATELPQHLKEWAKFNPVVSVGIDSDIAPLDYLDSNKKPIGLGELYRIELNKILPITLVVTSATDFSTEMNNLKSGQIDALSFCSKSESRIKDMLFTKTVWRWPSVLAVPLSSNIKTVDDLKPEHIIGGIKGYINLEIAEELVGKQNVVEANDLFTGLDRTTKGEFDAFITTDLTFMYNERGRKEPRFHVITLDQHEHMQLGFCVNKEKKQVVDILNWGIENIDNEKLANLQLDWTVQQKQATFDADSAENNKLYIAVLVVAILIILIIYKGARQAERMSLRLGTRKFTSVFIFLLVTFVGGLIAFSIIRLSQFYTESVGRFEQILNLKHANVADSLYAWYEERLSLVDDIATLPQFKLIIEDLVKSYEKQDAVNRTKAEERLIAFFSERRYTVINERSYSVVSLSGDNLFSNVKASIGHKNILYTQKSLLFSQVVDGQATFFPPVQNHLTSSSVRVLKNNHAQVSIAAPITNKSGKTIAVFTLNFDPAKSFSKVFQGSRIQDTLEAYGVDGLGHLITASQFEDELVSDGKLKPGTSSILNVFLPDKFKNPIVHSAKFGLNGKNFNGYKDYRGADVIGQWTWMKDFSFSIVIEIDKTEVEQNFISIRRLIFIILASAVLLIIALSTFLIVVAQRTLKISLQSQTELETRVDLRTKELVATQSTKNSIISSLAEGVFGVDKKGYCVFINESGGDILKAEESLEGLHFNDFFDYFYQAGDLTTDSYSTDSRENIISLAIECQQVMRAENVSVINQQGSIENISFSAAPIDNPDSDIAAVIAFQDVSQQFKEKQRIEQMLGAVPVAMLVVNNKNEIDYANNTTKSLFGWTLTELIRAPLSQFFPELDSRGAHYINSKDGHEQSVVNEVPEPITLFTKNREELKIEVTYQLIVIGDDIFNIISLRNVTKELAAKQALIDAKTLADEASRAKSDFLANMSHEIRTPMNAIIGMSHLALGFPLDSKPRNYIKKVHRASESLLGIINDILDFSKIEAGKIELESIDFNLDSLFSDVGNILSIQAHDKGLELLFNIDADVPRYLRGDSLRLSQVLINLANNAIKFTEHGYISINISLDKVTSKGVYLAFEVEDSGIGMNEQQIAKLFKSFSQGDSSTTRKYGGTGLGLTICKSLVHAMGGDISVKSEEGKGSCFLFNLMLALPESEELSKFCKSQIDLLKDRKILVIDDNEKSLNVCSKILTSFGCNVTGFLNADDAIRTTLQTAQCYDFIFVDWNMPSMTGIQAIAELQKTIDADTKFFLMTTAYNKDKVKQLVEDADDIQVDSYLIKPVTASVVFDDLMRLLGQSYVITSQKYKQKDVIDRIKHNLSGSKLLLVEDNELNQELAIELLREVGIEVELAENGVKAIELASLYIFDCILMDLQMPIMDGYTATGIIRQEQPDIPIIAMTANALTEDKSKVLDVGMTDHISKPINVEEMYITLSKWVSPPKKVKISQLPFYEERGDEKQEKIDLLNVDFTYINLEQGLKTCNMNERLYLRLLRKFMTNQQSFVEHFNEAWAEKKFKDALILAHTLKGTAGNLGALKLMEHAGALEKLCVEPIVDEKIQTQFHQCSTVLDNVLNELAAYFQMIDSQSLQTDKTIKVDLTVHLDDFYQLYTALEMSDTDALEFAEPIADSLAGSEYLTDFKAILLKVEEYDFDNAFKLLKEFIQLHNLDIHNG